MPKTITKTVYEFDELDERAKQRVKEWLNENTDDGFEFVLEDFKVVVETFGFTLRTTGGGLSSLRDSIYWTSYPWSAGFCADWAFPDTSVTEQLGKHLGDGDTLHKDAATFEAALARFRLAHNEAIAAGNLTATITADEHGCHKVEYYDPENFTNDDGRDFTPAEKTRLVEDYTTLYDAVKQAANDLGHWLAKNLEAEHDSHWEDDYVKGTCDANEYLFDEYGSVA